MSTMTEAPKAEENALDQLSPRAEAESKQFIFDHQGIERVYVQREMPYFFKVEFFELLSKEINNSMQGEGGLTVEGIFNSIGPDLKIGDTLSVDSFKDVDTFVTSLTAVTSNLREFMEESYCIWLSIPREERWWAKSAMTRPASEGGLSDDEGLEIIDRFLAQNREALADFFKKLMAKWGKRFQASSQGTASSKSSKNTRRTTPKR